MIHRGGTPCPDADAGRNTLVDCLLMIVVLALGAGAGAIVAWLS